MIWTGWSCWPAALCRKWGGASQAFRWLVAAGRRLAAIGSAAPGEADDVIEQPRGLLGHGAEQYIGVMGAGVDDHLAGHTRRAQTLVKCQRGAGRNGLVRVAMNEQHRRYASGDVGNGRGGPRVDGAAQDVEYQLVGARVGGVEHAQRFKVIHATDAHETAQLGQAVAMGGQPARLEQRQARNLRAG